MGMKELHLLLLVRCKFIYSSLLARPHSILQIGGTERHQIKFFI